MKRLIWISGIVLVLSAGGVAWRLAPRQSEILTDAERIREPSNSAPLRRVLWQPAQLLPQQINSDRDDYEPRISADGQTLFFVQGKAGGAADIYTCRRTPRGWSAPEALTGVNSDHDDLGPEPSPDGQSLYFYSDRAGGLGGYDLWFARRDHDTWRTPVNLGPSVNSPFNDYGPAIAPDGKTLYFASNRPKPGEKVLQTDAWPATLREEFVHRDYDLYSAAVTDAGIDRAAPLIGLNTPYNEGAPAVSPFGDFLYFSSDRPGGFGGFDLYRSRHVQGEFRAAENLGSAVNTDANELDPAMSLGGYGLYFSSNRPNGAKQSESPPRYRLYSTTSREVFAESEVQQARVDWGGMWRQIGPHLLWGLLALLLLVLLMAILRDARRRKLSLLTRCLIGSVIAHLLAMFLLNFWHVTTGIVDAVRHGGGRIQVAISGSSKGGGIAMQIRGGLTDVSIPTPKSVAPARLALPIAVLPRIAAAQLAVFSTERSDQVQLRFPTIAEAAAPRLPRGSPLAATPPPPAAPQALDVTLPADATRIVQQEPDSSLAPPANVDLAVGRLKRVVATSQPAGLDATVSLSPHSSVSDVTTDADPRWATGPAADALPRLATSRHLPVSPALVATPLGVELPPAESGASERGTEPGVRISTAISTPQRAAVSGVGASASGGDTIQEIAPQPFDNGNLSGPSIALAVAGAAPDAHPGIGPIAQIRDVGSGDATRVGGPSSAFMADVRLPASEAGSGAGDAFNGDEAVARLSVPVPGVERAGKAGSGFGARSGSSSQMYSIAPSAAAGTGKPIPDAQAGAPARDAIVSLTPSAPAGAGSRAAAASVGDISLKLSLPTESKPPENPYVQRQSDTKLDIAKRMGGSEKTERAVASALMWLARHQSADGHWSGGHFDDDCGRCGGQTDIEADVALTGLSLLCFLGAGHTHAKEGPYRDVVKRGVDWLLEQQSEDGDLRGDETMYSHGIASIVLSESYGMTHDERLALPVRRAVGFIAGAVSPRGGWRYTPGQFGDTSVLGWQVMALKSASLSGIELPNGALDSARAWIARVDNVNRPGLYGYQPRGKATRSMTAEGMFALQLLGASRDEPPMRTSAEYIAQELPDWGRKPNTYYWYYGTLALYQQQGPHWKAWNDALTSQLLPHQRAKGAAAGSWDPVGEWAKTGGRVYQTTLCTLMLEVYYRYLPLYSMQAAGNPSEQRK